MPTRILREGILTSEPVNNVSERAELFYRRLMSVADDYGRFFSNPAILRASCYPLRLKTVSESNVKQLLSECVAAGILVVYGAGKYVQIVKFKQQTRSASKFPEPTKDELLIKCESNVNHLCSESESESESESYTVASRVVLVFLNEQSGKHFRESNESLAPINARLKEPGVTVDGAKQMIQRQAQLWQGTRFMEFMRPSTLFGKEKFNEYYAAKDQPVSRNTNAANGSNPRNVGVCRAGPDFGQAAKAKQLQQQNAERERAVAGELAKTETGTGPLPPAR